MRSRVSATFVIIMAPPVAGLTQVFTKSRYGSVSPSSFGPCAAIVCYPRSCHARTRAVSQCGIDFHPTKRRRWVERNSGQVENLTGLRSRNHPLEVCVLAVFAGPFLTFSRALDPTLLLLLLFLSADAFSLAFIHAFCLRERYLGAVRNRDAVQMVTCFGAPSSGSSGLHQRKISSRADVTFTSGCGLDLHRHHCFDRVALR